MKLVKDNVDKVLFNENDSVFYIFQKDQLNKNNKVLTLDYPSMKKLSCKKVVDLEEEILQRMVGREPVEIIDESVFNKRVKEYFNKQVEKEQALNQESD